MEDLIKNCHNFFPEYYVRSFELGDFEKEGMCVDYDYPRRCLETLWKWNLGVRFKK